MATTVTPGREWTSERLRAAKYRLSYLDAWTDAYPPVRKPYVRTATATPYQGIGPRLSECRCIGHDPDPDFGRDTIVTTRVVAPFSIRAAIDRRTAVKPGKAEKAELTEAAYCEDRVRYESVATPEDDPAMVWDSLLGNWFPMVQKINLRTGGKGTVGDVQRKLEDKARSIAIDRALNYVLDVHLGIKPTPVDPTLSVTCWTRHLDRMRRYYDRLQKGMPKWVSRWHAPLAPMVRPTFERPVYFGTLDDAAQEAETFAVRFASAVLAQHKTAERWAWFDAAGTEHHVTRA